MAPRPCKCLDVPAQIATRTYLLHRAAVAGLGVVLQVFPGLDLGQSSRADGEATGIQHVPATVAVQMVNAILADSSLAPDPTGTRGSPGGDFFSLHF